MVAYGECDVYDGANLQTRPAEQENESSIYNAYLQRRRHIKQTMASINMQ